MPKKTFNEKLQVANGLPKIEFIGYDHKMAQRFGCGNMLVAHPLEYDDVMRRVPYGKLITSEEIRKYLAQKHGADFTCPLTAGIFINLVAHASQEREDAGSKDVTPYWRTLKKGGVLNEKYPGGIAKQKMLLEQEGHEVIVKGKRYYVKDYERALVDLSTLDE